MRISVAMLLLLLTSIGVSDIDSPWFLPRNCVGPDFSLEISFDDSVVFKTYGPACIGYKDNANRDWSEETLTVTIVPNREITWVDYREESFNSPVDSELIVDLWLAGAVAEQSQWRIGVSVRDKYIIYTITTHLASLYSKSELCVAPKFCIRTQPIKRLLMVVTSTGQCNT